MVSFVAPGPDAIATLNEFGRSSRNRRRSTVAPSVPHHTAPIARLSSYAVVGQSRMRSQMNDSGTAPPVILVVEDEVLVRLLAVDMLVEAGFEVIEARTADDAVLVLNQRSD